VAVIDVTGPGTENVGQGTPGQFSRAAFFQRTFNSSRLNKAFLFISKGSFSLDVFPPNGIPPFALVCPIPNKGSSKRGKNLIIILTYFSFKFLQTSILSKVMGNNRS
jgi:hypothetical protein